MVNSSRCPNGFKDEECSATDTRSTPEAKYEMTPDLSSPFSVRVARPQLTFPWKRVTP